MDFRISVTSRSASPYALLTGIALDLGFAGPEPRGLRVGSRNLLQQLLPLSGPILGL
jgi:hypothetical protein